jgi:hypothetical protein
VDKGAGNREVMIRCKVVLVEYEQKRAGNEERLAT